MSTPTQQDTLAITESVVIDTPFDAVFAVVSNPTNLPHWIDEFVSVAPDGENWLLETSFAGVTARLVMDADSARGTVDVQTTSQYGTHYVYSRVLRLGDAKSVYLFTRFVGAGEMGGPDAVRAASVERLNKLKALVEKA